MGSCSGKITLSIDDKLKLEISKMKGENIEVNLINLLNNYDKYPKKDKEYVKEEIKKYMEVV
jgi:hypothetical protein